MVELSLDQLRDLGLTQFDWEKLHGKLEGDVLQGGEGLGPEEYRQLIRAYSEAIAKEKTAPGKKPR